MAEEGEIGQPNDQEIREREITDLYVYYRHVLESEGVLFHRSYELFDNNKPPEDSASLQTLLDEGFVKKTRESGKPYNAIQISTDKYPCNCGGKKRTLEESRKRRGALLSGVDPGGPRPKLPEDQPIRFTRVALRGTYVLDPKSQDNCVFETTHWDIKKHEEVKETRSLTQDEIGEIKSWQGRMKLRLDPLKPIITPDFNPPSQ